MLSYVFPRPCIRFLKYSGVVVCVAFLFIIFFMDNNTDIKFLNSINFESVIAINDNIPSVKDKENQYESNNPIIRFESTNNHDEASDKIREVTSDKKGTNKTDKADSSSEMDSNNASNTSDSVKFHPHPRNVFINKT